jgi:concanavalin A-like lectin/glucanase superfamily protein/stigma-specific protein Stig1
MHMHKHRSETHGPLARQIWSGLPVVAMAGLLLVACGDSGHGAQGDGAAGAGGASNGGTAGRPTGGTGGAASGGTGGGSAGGKGGAASGGTGGGSSAGAGGASSGGASGGSVPGAGGAASGGTGGAHVGDGGAATDASDARPDAGTDAPPPAPATTISTSTIDFGGVNCGTMGGDKTLSFSNTGTASLHYRASVDLGGLFSLQGAASDGSASGDVSPGASATLTIAAGIVPTSSAAGAVLQGVLSVTTNAAGADNTSIPLTLTAQGGTCTLTCGAFTKCAPASASPYCANTATDNANCGTCGNSCGVGEVCTNGVCALTCGVLTKCAPVNASAYCANTASDASNCGTCGNACTTGQVCSSGLCTLSCGALTKCSPSSGAPYCANTITDNANCGTCGNACGPGQVCSGGLCTITCGVLTTCSPTTGAPYCANTITDNANCGTCGNACGAGQVCTAGVCKITCGSLTTCSPTAASPYCANLTTDNANCGACGTSCGAGLVCTAGACSLSCGSLTTCSPTAASPYCANLTTDNANCGTCGHGCATGQACIAGACQATCATNETTCAGMCTNTSFDPSNCGSCGNTCSFPQGSGACAGGGCFLASCNAGYLDCNHLQADGCEVNKNTSAANCGACGAACALGESCNLGVCTADLSQGLIGYWKMDDAFGSTSAADSSSNHLNGQVVGNATFVAGAGKQGSGAVSFGGSGYLRVPFPNNAKNQGTGVFIPQGNITFAMWFRTSSSAVGGLQVIEGNGAWGPGCDRVIGNGGGGTLDYNDWSEINMSGVTPTNDGGWHQVVYVMDETSGLKAYVDGVPDVSSASPTSNCGEGCSGFNWAAEYWIGRSAGCRYGADYFVGLVDDVRLYDHVLSPTAVLQLYNATK